MTEDFKMPDAKLCRDEWLRIVQPVERAGRLDKIPARPIKTKLDKKIAEAQRIGLSQRTFSMPDNYDKIDWSK